MTGCSAACVKWRSAGPLKGLDGVRGAKGTHRGAASVAVLIGARLPVEIVTEDDGHGYEEED